MLLGLTAIAALCMAPPVRAQTQQSNASRRPPLGPATPRYLFTDTNSPAVPQRYYRLRWP